MDNSSRIAIGLIHYANAWPLFHYLEPVIARTGLAGIELRRDVPSELNLSLEQGRTDITAVSSFAYAKRHRDYLLLPDLSVSADGDVRSILLFAKRPIGELRSVALTNTSATSVNMLKLILAERYGLRPQYITTEPVLDRMLDNADAALLIGDPAITASWLPNDGLYVYDLGREWKEWTGHGMTFAVVAINKRTAARLPERVAAVNQALQESKRQGLSHTEELAVKAVGELGGDHNYWSSYFRNLLYAFGESQRAGLAFYFERAYHHGILPEKVSMEFWTDQYVAQVNE